MKLTAGHDCIHPGCPQLAVFGLIVNGETRWACREHRSAIAYSHQPAGPAVPADDRTQTPLSSPRSSASAQSQGRLL